nr:MAG TPA: hypothetical protein [Caudoviricetes sp.]
MNFFCHSSAILLFGNGSYCTYLFNALIPIFNFQSITSSIPTFS